jgi:hypothetical protein
MNMFSFFFDSGTLEQTDKPQISSQSRVIPQTESCKKERGAGPAPEKYEIDAGYYFKHLDPAQIQNVLTNFETEMSGGQ